MRLDCYSSYFEHITRPVLAKIRKLQQERISAHYELCANNENEVEIVPFDCFWEQVFQEMNLKKSTTALSPLNFANINQHQDALANNPSLKINPRIGCGYGGFGGFEPFCTISKFELVGVRSRGIGALPKSLVYLNNGDIVLGTFSQDRGGCIKTFTATPFEVTPLCFVADASVQESQDTRTDLEDFGGFFSYFSQMHYSNTQYRIYPFDDAAFYKFDSK